MLNMPIKSQAMSLDVKESDVTAGGLGFLIGRFEHALDPKRRITVPSLWRTQLGSPDSLYILPNPHAFSLTLLSPKEMALWMEGVRKRAPFDRELGRSLKVLGESSEQVMLDVQGRIRIRDRLLAFAGLTERVVMVGECNRIELWSPERCPEEKEIPQMALADAYSRLFVDRT